jgi:Mce-associated membrane protein
MTPTWYDLLGVEPDASVEEIRTAWKGAIADLDPGDRRFRTLNEAAEVLLDPDTRSAYDETLVPEEPLDETQPEETRDEEAQPEETQAETPLTRRRLTGGTKRGRSSSDGSGETDARQEALSDTEGEQGPRTTDRRTIPAWLLAALAVLTAVALATAGYLATQPSDDAIADSTSDAQGAAERAVTTVLAYDYRHLDADQKAAEELMTPAYQKKYDALFTQIAANAPDLKVVVTTEVVASGIVRSGEDRVQVLVFVNRPTLRADKTEPEIYRDQVVMTMVKSGGDWLVDDMDTNQLAS